RPIQLVVTVPPGGAADFVARTNAAALRMAIEATLLPWTVEESDAGIIACMRRWVQLGEKIWVHNRRSIRSVASPWASASAQKNLRPLTIDCNSGVDSFCPQILFDIAI